MRGSFLERIAFMSGEANLMLTCRYFYQYLGYDIALWWYKEPLNTWRKHRNAKVQLKNIIKLIDHGLISDERLKCIENLERDCCIDEFVRQVSDMFVPESVL